MTEFKSYLAQQMTSDADQCLERADRLLGDGVTGDREFIAAIILEAVLNEREACAKFVETTYRHDDGYSEALRARFVVPEAKSGYLEAWHAASDVADAIRNRTNLEK